QVPAISMGGVMLPISMASTCCIAWGNAAPQEGLPSNFSNSALFWVRLLMNYPHFPKLLPGAEPKPFRSAPKYQQWTVYPKNRQKARTKRSEEHTSEL